MLRTALLSLFSIALMAQDSQAPQSSPRPARPARAQQARQAPMPRTATPQRALPTAIMEKPENNNPIGIIDGTTYHEYDFLDYAPLVYQPGALEQLKARPELRKQAQKSYLETMLLVHLAKKEGVDQTPEFQAKLDAITKLLLTQEIMIKKTPELDKLAKATEEQLKSHYDNNVTSFRTEEKASARHILVGTRSNENETDKPTDEEALAKMAMVKMELAAGKSWDEAAREYSDDPGSKQNGGLYENFNPAQMVAPFAQAVRTQPVGSLGEPVKTQFGYHLILVENFEVGKQLTFDEAKAGIERQLAEQRRPEVWNAFVSSLKAEFGYSEAEEVAGETVADKVVETQKP